MKVEHVPGGVNVPMFVRTPNKVRPTAVAGSFYPRAPEELRAMAAGLLSQAEIAAPSHLLGIVAPHAGYMYSGGVAGKAFASLAASAKRVNRVLLLGPPHYLPVHGIAAPSARAFATPLGEVEIDTEAIRSLEAAGLVEINDAAHTPEHSLEVELPFLQIALGSFKLVPLLVGGAPPEQTAAVIDALLDDTTLLVISTDLSHYLDDRTARSRDLATAESIERREFKHLGPEQACGYSALSGALCAAAAHDWNVTRLDLRNSGETSGDRNRVVGYGAWSFSLPH